MKIQKMTILGAALLGTVAAASSAAVIAEFNLSDHPQGDAAPPAYGLRLDNIVGGGIAVLSMDHFGDTVMTVEDNGGDLSVHITGTLWGGSVVNHAFVDPQAYTIDFTYAVNVAASGNGWEVAGFDVNNNGILTHVDSGDETVLYGKAAPSDSVFRMLDDGYRITGDTTSFVGLGWLTRDITGGNSNGGAQDWLFVATPVPAPAGVAVLGLAGLMSTRRRR